MRRALFVFALLTLVVAACAPQATATEQQSIIGKRPTAVTERSPIIARSPTATSVPQKPTSTPKQSAAGAAEQPVIKQLAANLGIEESDISVLSSKVVEFRDGCLGVSMPDVMCTQVITPGRIIVLEANGIQYEYHTSANGSRVQPATLALTWKRSGGIAGFCDTLVVFLSGEVYAAQCKPQADGKMGTFAKLLSSEEQAKFTDWMTTFAMSELDASDPKGVKDGMTVTLEVFGLGSEPPTKSEQQALFEFSQGLYQKLMQ
ncbi:MAG TPA: hypothetical protein VKP08_09235 [Anaerolineales bacterium]|nr:hypothetical protein [Anaerolineales bacterium]